MHQSIQNPQKTSICPQQQMVPRSQQHRVCHSKCAYIHLTSVLYPSFGFFVHTFSFQQMPILTNKRSGSGHFSDVSTHLCPGVHETGVSHGSDQ
jgi:hypothetical protein